LLSSALFSFGLLLAILASIKIESAKTTDVAVAYFTYCLVVVGAFQVWWQEKVTRILERAYLTVKPLGIETYRTKDNVIGLIAFCNSGRLPAKNVSWFLDRGCDTNRRLAHFPVDENHFVGSQIVPPGGEMIKGTGPIQIDDFTNIIASTPQVYVWGVVRYDDGFGTLRTTEFCHRYDCSGVEKDGAGRYIVPAKDGRQHEFGNKAD
jgi:hypothetical protein